MSTLPKIESIAVRVENVIPNTFTYKIICSVQNSYAHHLADFAIMLFYKSSNINTWAFDIIYSEEEGTKTSINGNHLAKEFSRFTAPQKDKNDIRNIAESFCNRRCYIHIEQQLIRK
jgi:hypothetical protein